ncbi:MAG: hypothetical protein ABJB98_09810 [Actinomycetota bacterium]
MTSAALPPGFRADESTAAPGQPEVGEFRPGSPGSQYLLGRYLIGRVLGEYVTATLLVVGLATVALAIGMYFLAPTWIAVLVGLVAIAVLVLRALFAAVLRRFSGAAVFGPVEDRMRPILADTRSDVRGELRRVGLPSRAWSMPLFAWRLRRRRRADTLRRIGQFDAARVVPPARVDQLHLLLRSLETRRP